MTTPINHFDRGKPFYPLVTSYVLQLLGLKEIMVRGIIGKRTIEISDISRYIYNSNNPQDQDIQLVISQLEKLLGPLELKSEQSNDAIAVEPDQLAQELINNHNYLLPDYFYAATNILVLAHELTKDAPYRDTGPLWEFLYHCRNAVAHGGRFYFINNQPRHSAIWGRFTLTRSLHGTRLFKDAGGDGLLSPGDPIRLLWDIEQAYPNMSV